MGALFQIKAKELQYPHRIYKPLLDPDDFCKGNGGGEAIKDILGSNGKMHILDFKYYRIINFLSCDDIVFSRRTL